MMVTGDHRVSKKYKAGDSIRIESAGFFYSNSFCLFVTQNNDQRIDNPGQPKQ